MHHAASNELEAPAAKYRVLPPPVDRALMRATQDVRPLPETKGEHDRETEHMLRATGVFI